MLSITCKTALKARIFLASKFDSDQKFSIKDISEYIAANEHTVGKVLQTLVKESIINSSKGPTGGFYITDKQMALPVLRIVESIDGESLFNECGLGLSKCSATHPCPIHNEYKHVRDGFKQICIQNSVKDLCLPINNGLAFLMD